MHPCRFNFILIKFAPTVECILQRNNRVSFVFTCIHAEWMMEFLVMDNFAIYCFHFQQYTMQVKNIDGRKKIEALDQTKVVFE